MGKYKGEGKKITTLQKYPWEGPQPLTFPNAQTPVFLVAL
jgi:hypothetical protein